jgi:hypothetical protein
LAGLITQEMIKTITFMEMPVCNVFVMNLQEARCGYVEKIGATVQLKSRLLEVVE